MQSPATNPVDPSIKSETVQKLPIEQEDMKAEIEVTANNGDASNDGEQKQQKISVAARVQQIWCATATSVKKASGALKKTISGALSKGKKAEEKSDTQDDENKDVETEENTN
eukprot:177477_1